MFYDPMISKLCTYSESRDSSIKEMINALDRYYIEGVKTNRDFLSNILSKEKFSLRFILYSIYLKSIRMDIILMMLKLKIKKYYIVWQHLLTFSIY